MQIKSIGVKDRIRTVADRWRVQNQEPEGSWKTSPKDPRPREETYRLLAALVPDNTSVKTVLEIVRPSWIEISCDICGEVVKRAVQLSDDGEDELIYCPSCVGKMGHALAK